MQKEIRELKEEVKKIKKAIDFTEREDEQF